MNLIIERYSEQIQRWPSEGRHILAQFDAESIVVYQAYRPSIGHYAAAHGHFGGPDFGVGRMSWIKPNFLWMMYRCGWGTKENQEVVLAIRIRREGFDQILRQAVPSTFEASDFVARDEWQRQIENSQVRLQWDPDHDPHGGKVARRAIQLGLRGDVLKAFAGPWIVSIDDISSFVHEQQAALVQHGIEGLATPREEPYLVADAEIRKRLGMEPLSANGPQASTV